MDDVSVMINQLNLYRNSNARLGQELHEANKKIQEITASRGPVKVCLYDSFSAGFSAGAEAMRAKITQEFIERSETALESMAVQNVFGIAARICANMKTPEVTR